ncbi:nuclear transport factor 2 family protein [Streptomyces sp. NPDC006365]|uniref:nuclear transport factor 2 family protein n=1 Tax=Streptomyces sp. NPDC006365 TaxID=3364744 RepID=UPI0036811F4E
MPNIPVEQIGREEILAGGERLQSQWGFFVQNTHPGMILLDGDTATGRAYMQDLARTLDGRQGLNYAVCHDRYQRTAEGWKFAERVYEVRYLDTSPLAGTAPRGAQGSGTGPAHATATPAPAASFADPASAEQLERVAAALRANGFAAEILDDAAEARPHQGPGTRGRLRAHRSQRDPPAVRHRRRPQRQRPVRRH